MLRLRSLQLRSFSTYAALLTGFSALFASSVHGDTRNDGRIWDFCANEGGRCVFEGNRTVKFGTWDRFDLKVFNGSASCTVAAFSGVDPATGLTKWCFTDRNETAAPAPAPTPTPPPAPTASWTFCANEGGFCRFTGTRQVRFGADSMYVVKTVTARYGGTWCSSRVFGNPIDGVAKRCEVDGSPTPVLTPSISAFSATPKTVSAGQAATLAWNVGNATSISIDNGVGTVSGSQVVVRPNVTTTYVLTARNASGASTRSVTVSVIATQPQPAVLPSIASFGASPASIVAGNSSTLSWSVSNAESVSISPSVGVTEGSSVVVRPTQNTTYTLTARNTQGSVTRTVAVAVNAAPSPDHSGMGPYIDRSKIPSGSNGSAVDKLSPTSERPAPNRDNVGAFRTVCAFSHMNFDDPMVYPNQPGAAHLHAYFGNTGINAASNEQSIRTTGNSTCRGGTINRSAYWVPAMIDTRTGAPVKPESSHFYYKTGYSGLEDSAVNEIPQGLRMIAGSAKASAPQPRSGRFKCVNAATYGSSIQNCPVGDELWQEIFFPQCWDGRNLDSPDHQSHMAYLSNARCPSTHPVVLPEITFNIVYKIREANAPLRWRLSSDMYPTTSPGGYSNHGDWFNGWKKDISDTFVQRCIRPGLDCGSHLTGDGRQMNE